MTNTNIKRNLYYGYVIVFILFMFQIVMTIPRTSFGVFIKPLIADFGWPTALIAGVYSVSSLVQGVSGILMGWLNDKLGPRVVLTICGTLIGTGLIFVRFIDSAWQLYLLFAMFVGTGMGGLFGPQMSTIARWFVKNRNSMTGLLMTGRGVGGFIGPIVITNLAYGLGWREAFLTFGIVIFVVVVIGSQFLRRDPSIKARISDIAKNQAGEKELSQKSGLTLRQAYHTVKFWLLAFAIFCAGFCLTMPTVHIVPLAIDRGISPTIAAIVLSFYVGASSVANVIVGIMADRIGTRRTFITCVGLIFSITLLLIPITSPWILALILVILALGSGGIAVISSGLVAELFGMKSHGVVLGCFTFGWALGGAAGAYTGGLVYDITGGYQSVFLLCGFLVILAFISTVFLNYIRIKELIPKSAESS